MRVNNDGRKIAALESSKRTAARVSHSIQQYLDTLVLCRLVCRSFFCSQSASVREHPLLHGIDCSLEKQGGHLKITSMKLGSASG